MKIRRSALIVSWFWTTVIIAPAGAPAARAAAGSAPGKTTEPPRSFAEAVTGFKPVWVYASFGQGIGKSNIVVANNGAGTEIYLGASTTTFGPDDYWYVLRYRPLSGNYEHVFVSPIYDVGIQRVVAGDVLNGPGQEILIALADGRVEIYDQQSKARLAEISTAANAPEGLAVADVDSDGQNEIILCTADGLYVYATSGSLEWQLPNAGGDDVVVGQMDADPALEIAVTDGSVVDTATRAVQWKWPNGFGHILAAKDIDTDGRDELIAAESWNFVWAFDVDRQLPKWSIPFSHDIGAIHVTDIDGDSVFELLVGEGQYGDVSAFSTVTQALEWSIHNPGSGVTDIAVGDVDMDGSTEVLWGSGATSTGRDKLYVADWQTLVIEWENLELEGPFNGPEIGDLDGDGIAEVVALSYSSDAGNGSGRIVVFNSQNLSLKAVSDEIVGGNAWTGAHDLKLRDVDGDGRQEILVATDRLSYGVIEIYDFANSSFTLSWTNATQPFGSPFYTVDAADIDGDGQLEIVAGGGRENTAAAGVFVYVYDYLSGAEAWHSDQVGGYWDSIAGLGIADFDGDGALEIAGMVGSGDTYIFDGPSKALETILLGSYTDLQVVPAAARPLLMMSDTAGDLSIHGYSGGAYTELFRRNFVPEPIDGFTYGVLGRLWIGSGGTLKLMGPGGPAWESARYGTTFGARVVKLPSAPVVVTAGSYSISAFIPVVGP